MYGLGLEQHSAAITPTHCKSITVYSFTILKPQNITNACVGLAAASFGPKYHVMSCCALLLSALVTLQQANSWFAQNNIIQHVGIITFVVVHVSTIFIAVIITISNRLAQGCFAQNHAPRPRTLQRHWLCTTILNTHTMIDVWLKPHYSLPNGDNNSDTISWMSVHMFILLDTQSIANAIWLTTTFSSPQHIVKINVVYVSASQHRKHNKHCFTHNHIFHPSMHCSTDVCAQLYTSHHKANNTLSTTIVLKTTLFRPRCIIQLMVVGTSTISNPKHFAQAIDLLKWTFFSFPKHYNK